MSTKRKAKQALRQTNGAPQLAAEIAEIPGKPAKIPQAHGGALYTGGVPGHKGGAGRPKDAWKAKMRTLADRFAQQLEAKRILEDPDHPQWLAAGKFVAEQAYGKATEKLEVEADVQVTQTWEVAGRRITF